MANFCFADKFFVEKQIEFKTCRSSLGQSFEFRTTKF